MSFLRSACGGSAGGGFDIYYSIFAFSEFLFRLDWPLFRPAAGLTPDTSNLLPATLHLKPSPPFPDALRRVPYAFYFSPSHLLNLSPSIICPFLNAVRRAPCAVIRAPCASHPAPYTLYPPPSTRSRVPSAFETKSRNALHIQLDPKYTAGQQQRLFVPSILSG